METFDIIKSDVLQGSKVVLDVEQEGLDERTVLSLDAATKISSSGSTCFHSSDGKEHCFAEAQPGECSSFADHEGRRELNWFKKTFVKPVESAADKAKRLATEAANAAKAEAERVAAAAKAAADKAAADAKAAADKAAREAAAAAAAAKAAADKAAAAAKAEAERVAREAAAAAKAEAERVAREAEKQAAAAKALADKVAAEAAAAAKLVETTANNAINSMKAIALGPVYQAAVKVTNDAMKTAKVADAALDDIEAGAKLAGKALEAGAKEVAAAGVLIAEWVEANYCEIGISTALGIFFAALLYRPEPTAVATTTAATAPLTTTAATYLVAKASVGGALIGTMCDLVAAAFVELILVVNDIKNAIGSNKDILIDAIGMSLALGFEAAAGAMVVPQACAAVVAGLITILVAQLVCKKTLPYSDIKVRMLEDGWDGWEGGN